MIRNGRTPSARGATTCELKSLATTARVAFADFCDEHHTCGKLAGTFVALWQDNQMCSITAVQRISADISSVLEFQP